MMNNLLKNWGSSCSISKRNNNKIKTRGIVSKEIGRHQIKPKPSLNLLPFLFRVLTPLTFLREETILDRQRKKKKSPWIPFFYKENGFFSSRTRLKACNRTRSIQSFTKWSRTCKQALTCKNPYPTISGLQALLSSSSKLILSLWTWNFLHQAFLSLLIVFPTPTAKNPLIFSKTFNK